MKPKSKLIIDFSEDESPTKSRDCTIILDGKILGSITNGEKKEFNIAPGKHSLFIARKSYNSLDCKFQAEPNKEIYLEIRFEPVEPYPQKFAVVVNQPDPVEANPPVLRKG